MSWGQKYHCSYANAKKKLATPHILSRLHLQLSSRLLFKPQSLNHNKLQENLVSEWSTVLEMQSTGTMLFGPAYTNSPIHHGPSQLLLFIVSWAQCSAALLWGPLSKCLSSMAVLPAEIWMVLALLDTLQREGISLAQWFSRSDTPGKERRVIGFPTLLWASSAGRACQIGARSRCWAWWG